MVVADACEVCTGTIVREREDLERQVVADLTIVAAKRNFKAHFVPLGGTVGIANWWKYRLKVGTGQSRIFQRRFSYSTKRS